jgi:hypothetical protein
MPDTRTHRGPHPDDTRLFGEAMLPVLRDAATDYCWLLNRGYPTAATLALVGNQFRLDQRQRMAIARFACTDAQRRDRAARQLVFSDTRGRPLLLDGFNVLTTVEAALANAVVLVGRDGTFRDLAGMHGAYRKVEETVPALELIGQTLAACGIEPCRWWLDSPVSNSCRLKAVMLDLADVHGWPWTVELANNPDAVLKRASEPIATADSVILDGCGDWVNVAREVVERHVPNAWILNMDRETASP